MIGSKGHGSDKMPLPIQVSNIYPRGTRADKAPEYYYQHPQHDWLSTQTILHQCGDISYFLGTFYLLP